MSAKLIEIGYIQKAHGIKGEVFFKPYDEGVDYLKTGQQIRLGEVDFTLLQARVVPSGVILRLKEVTTRNESELLRASKVYVSSEVFGESEGGFYLNQLLNFDVIFKGAVKGQVVGFGLTDAHDLLRVRLSGLEDQVEIPYVDNFVLKINKLDKNIEVNCPEELFDLEFLGETKR